MKIFVEAGRLSTAQFTGISNVIAQALIAWADASPNDQFIVASHSAFNPDFENKAKLRSNIQLRIDPVPSLIPDGARNAFWFYFRVPLIVRRLDPDLYWASSSLVPFGLPTKLRVLTIVYDLVPVLYRKTMTRKGRLLTALSYRYSIKRANLLWTISNYVKRELHKHVPESHGKPIVVACAIDHEQYKPQNLSQEDKRAVLSAIAPGHPGGKTLLFVGTTEPRKNLRFLLSLMPELAKHQISLIVVGARGWGQALDETAKAIASNPENRIFFAGRISNDDLAKLYASVDLFVSTSLDEGFCMPAVEAMACETPVVLAHNSAMKEIVGTGGLTVDKFINTDWITAILANAHRQIKYRPQSQSQKYYWSNQIQLLTHALRA